MVPKTTITKTLRIIVYLLSILLIIGNLYVYASNMPIKKIGDCEYDAISGKCAEIYLTPSRTLFSKGETVTIKCVAIDNSQLSKDYVSLKIFKNNKMVYENKQVYRHPLIWKDTFSYTFNDYSPITVECCVETTKCAKITLKVEKYCAMYCLDDKDGDGKYAIYKKTTYPANERDSCNYIPGYLVNYCKGYSVTLLKKFDKSEYNNDKLETLSKDNKIYKLENPKNDETDSSSNKKEKSSGESSGQNENQEESKKSENNKRKFYCLADIDEDGTPEVYITVETAEGGPSYEKILECDKKVKECCKKYYGDSASEHCPHIFTSWRSEESFRGTDTEKPICNPKKHSEDKVKYIGIIKCKYRDGRETSSSITITAGDESKAEEKCSSIAERETRLGNKICWCEKVSKSSKEENKQKKSEDKSKEEKKKSENKKKSGDRSGSSNNRKSEDKKQNNKNRGNKRRAQPSPEKPEEKGYCCIDRDGDGLYNCVGDWSSSMKEIEKCEELGGRYYPKGSTLPPIDPDDSKANICYADFDNDGYCNMNSKFTGQCPSGYKTVNECKGKDPNDLDPSVPSKEEKPSQPEKEEKEITEILCYKDLDHDNKCVREYSIKILKGDSCEEGYIIETECEEWESPEEDVDNLIDYPVIDYIRLESVRGRTVGYLPVDYIKALMDYKKIYSACFFDRYMYCMRKRRNGISWYVIAGRKRRRLEEEPEVPEYVAWYIKGRSGTRIPILDTGIQTIELDGKGWRFVSLPVSNPEEQLIVDCEEGKKAYLLTKVNRAWVILNLLTKKKWYYDARNKKWKETDAKIEIEPYKGVWIYTTGDCTLETKELETPESLPELIPDIP